MSARPHEDIEALIAADALGGLDEADRGELDRALAEHGPDCAECRRLREDYADVAGRLSLTLDPVALSPGAEQRLLGGAGGGSAVAAAASVPRPDQGAAAPDAPGPGRWAGRRRPAADRRRVVALAVAAVLGLVGAMAAFLLAPSSGDPTVVVLSGPRGQLAVSYEPGADEGFILGSGLPEPATGKVYQLWFQRPGTTVMEPGATFVPHNGQVSVKSPLAEEMSLLAVTVEPQGGSRSPTAQPLFTGTVPSA